jgi:hypothetical protein
VERYFFEDGRHPRPEGYALMAAALARLIEDRRSPGDPVRPCRRTPRRDDRPTTSPIIAFPITVHVATVVDVQGPGNGGIEAAQVVEVHARPARRAPSACSNG